MLYNFRNYNDIIKKIEFDRSGIEISSEDITKNIYPLFNTILSLNQLFEWYYKDPELDIKKRAKCISKFNPYKKVKMQKKKYKEVNSELIFPLVENKKQLFILNICNDYKHFIIKKIEKTEKILKNTAVCGHNTRCGSTRCGASTFQYIVTDKEGEVHDIISTIDHLIAEWKRI